MKTNGNGNGIHKSKLETTRAAESRLLLSTYDRNAVLFTEADGVHLKDDRGNRYLDMLSGLGVNALGHTHPVIVDAIAAQSRKLMHISNLFYHEGQADLAMRLTEITGMDRAFFCNSGTEAWEAALKLARAHATLLRGEGKKIGTRVIALENSFHGRTMGSVATTHKAKYREPFEPVMPDVIFVGFDNVAELRAAFTEDVCAICIEPVQGEGGIRPVSKEFFAVARELCTSSGALLLADEIQCGMGRTGEWCAYQHYGIQPDVVTLAKPLAGGIPMGAMLCSEEAARAFTPGMHGTTFGGGPLACAVSIAVIDWMQQQNTLRHVREIGAYFAEQLHGLAAKHSCIVDVRGLGLMLCLELNSSDLAGQASSEMLARHIIINRTSETVLRFLPPYIIEKRHVDETIQALDAVLAHITQPHTSPVLAGESRHV
jgi:acetylornithine aminotransferase/acetylornithine/N-succinyldiaminopimelate aminotransferase